MNLMRTLIVAYLISGCLASGKFIAEEVNDKNTKGIIIPAVLAFNPIYWSYVLFKDEG